MHHPDVVNIVQNNVEINRVLSKTWNTSLTAAPGGFFYSFFSWLATADLFHVYPGGYYDGLFICS